MSRLRNSDPQVHEAIRNEARKQHSKIQLIASENYVSDEVLEAQGCIMTNKYAEGYPGKRYYGGCEFVDIVEDLARDRAKQLFGSDHVNVQPHSGSQANMAVYFSVLNPGDTILGMDLSHGGHLTHGSGVNFSGKIFHSVFYGVDKDTGYIDYEALEKKAQQEKPRIIVAGASAYPRMIDFARFRKIADSVDAYLMTDMAHIAGLVAAGVHPSPVPHSQFVTTTTHKTLRGPRGGMILCKSDHAKTVDKNIFPGIQGGPLMHVIAAKAVSFKEALSEDFRSYQKQVVRNSSVIANTLIESGFNLVSGGTDNHLMLVDLRNKGITGKDAEILLEQAGLIVNKNTVPFETESPFVTSGIRIGSPSITSRGMKDQEAALIADMIITLLDAADKEAAVKEVLPKVKKLCDAFPLYPELLKEYGQD